MVFAAISAQWSLKLHNRQHTYSKGSVIQRAHWTGHNLHRESRQKEELFDPVLNLYTPLFSLLPQFIYLSVFNFIATKTILR
jgi:hypothetical protein